MNRRGFLGMLVGGVAAGAAVRTWPFRVFSFPSEVAEPFIMMESTALGMDELNKAYTEIALGQELPDLIFVDTPVYKYLKSRADIYIDSPLAKTSDFYNVGELNEQPSVSRAIGA